MPGARLTLEDREFIQAALKDPSLSLRWIGRVLGKAH
jgi:IS30 family transposase